jgi:hypothetical protein
LNINAPVDRRDLWRFISFYFLSPVYLHLCVAPASWFAVLCFCLSLIFFFFLFLFIYIVIGFDPFDSKYIPQAMMAQSSWPLYKIDFIIYDIDMIV